jgi:ariadne-1
VSSDLIREVCGEDTLEDYEKVVTRAFEMDTHGGEYHVRVAPCKNPKSCGTSICIVDDADLQSVQCPKCLYAFCVECDVPSHSPAPCKTVVEWMALDLFYPGRDRDASVEMVKQISQPCPHCGARIQKDEGCVTMTCKLCNRK